MNKRLLIAALLLLGSAPAHALLAQGPPGGRPMPPGGRPMPPPGEILGIVLDESTNQPVTPASVAVWSTGDSTLVTGTLNGSDGSFRIQGLRPGRYYVRVSFLGYATRTVPDVAIAPGAVQADLGRILLAPDAVRLEGVEAAAERGMVTLRADRTIYETKDLPASSGGTATDVLRNVPAVEVDAEGKVSLRGSQNVAVQINGRAAPVRGDMLANFLQQLPANMVERVEVIPNPSAKYDPDGMAGILNIVLRQDAELGWSGGVNAGLGTGGRYNAGGNVGYQAGPLTLFGSYGYRVEERGTTGYNFRENRYTEPLTFLQQDLAGAFESQSHMFNGSADLRLGKKDVLSSSLILSSRNGENDGTNAHRLLDARQGVTDRYDLLTLTEHTDLSSDVSLSWRRTLEPTRHEISAEGRFNRSGDTFENDFTRKLLTPGGDPSTTPPELRRTDLESDTDQWTLQLDYTRGLGETTRLETGYKGQLRRIDNDYIAERFARDADEWVPESGRSNAFVFDEQVHGVYGVLHQGFGAVSLQAGVRLEQALTTFDLTTNAETFDNDYFSVFPSALIACNLDEARLLKASYSKRVERPNTRLLNPFAVSDDPLNVFQGNPQLKPEYIHSFELGYQHSAAIGSLQLTPFFRRTTNAVRRIKTVDESGVSTTSFLNFATSDSYGAETTGTFRLGGRWSGFANLSAFRVVTDGSNTDANVGSDAFGWSLRLSTTWQARPGTDVQWFYFYRAPLAVEQGRISSFSMANIAIQQKLFDDRATVAVRVTDPLNTMGFSFRTADSFYAQESRRKWSSRAAFLTFSYNVGQQPRLRRRGEREGQDTRGDVGEVGIQ